MANQYTGHKDEWKALSEIDYFGMFVKAYIPLNAWMNVNYPNLNTDRAKINEIKRNQNPLKNKICSLLESSSQDGTSFRNLIGEFHNLLENNYLYNQDKRITFTNVSIGKNTLNVDSDTHFGITFRVQFGNGNTTVTEVLIKNRSNRSLFFLSQSNYDIDELKNNTKFIAIKNEDYKNRLINIYKKVNPIIEIDLTKGFNPRKEEEYYTCGSFKFVRSNENIASGLIEIIYNMRNSLFHGELIPDKKANITYGAAYQILKILIEAI